MFISKESIFSTLFYTALLTSAISAIPALQVWVSLSYFQVFVLFLLGVGANLLFYCLLKAYSYCDASALAPFRYLELTPSVALSYLLFGEMPSQSLILGALIIVPSTFFILYREFEREKIYRLNQ